MRICVNKKIPLKMTNLPSLVEFINNDKDKLLKLVIDELLEMDYLPDSSNATFKQIASEFIRFRHTSTLDAVDFDFYCSKNPFFGKNVISHAVNSTINYNTRFHSCGSYELEDWIANFFHECTHLTDEKSMYSFSHENQKDYGAAPFVIGAMAKELYLKNYR